MSGRLSAGLYVSAEGQRIVGAGGVVPHRAVTSSSHPSPARVSVRERCPHSGEPVARAADVFGEPDASQLRAAPRPEKEIPKFLKSSKVRRAFYVI